MRKLEEWRLFAWFSSEPHLPSRVLPTCKGRSFWLPAPCYTSPLWCSTQIYRPLTVCSGPRVIAICIKHLVLAVGFAGPWEGGHRLSSRNIVKGFFQKSILQDRQPLFVGEQRLSIDIRDSGDPAVHDISGIFLKKVVGGRGIHLVLSIGLITF